MLENYPANELSWGRNAHTSHVWRYYLARGFIEKGWTVVDAACGSGYGSAILARSLAKRVFGLDYLAPNKQSYESDKVTLGEADFDKAAEIPICDYAVSIETVEHIDDAQGFAEMLKRQTKKLIFISTPIVETTQAALGKNKGTPFHHHDFSMNSLQKLFVDDKWGILHDSEQGRRHGLFVFYNVPWRRKYESHE